MGPHETLWRRCRVNAAGFERVLCGVPYPAREQRALDDADPHTAERRRAEAREAARVRHARHPLPWAG